MKGIYKITNLINNKIYIGSSVNIKARWASHKSGLNNNKQDTPYLQNAWNKYGEDSFEFKVLVELNTTEPALRLIEKMYIRNLNSKYNVDNDPTTNYFYGRKHSEESKKKMSKAQTGKKHTEETKNKMSKLRIGKNNHFYGKTHTKKTKEKISKAHKGKILSEEHKKILSETNKGKTVSEETKKKISISQAGESGNNSKLIKERVLMIRRMHLTEKYTQKVLGKIFNISFQHVSRIVNYKSWKYI